MLSRLLTIPAAFLIAFSSPLAYGDEGAEQMVLATYKLVNDSSTATGTVYQRECDDGKAQRFLVTAAHVFEGMKGDHCTIVSRKRRDDGLYMREEIQTAIRGNDKPLWTKHPTEDIAVLLLPESISINALPLDSLPTEDALKPVHVGDDVRSAVFPERSEANPAGLPILRGGVLASHPLLPVKPHPMFLIDTNAWPGDSGGPVAHKTLRSPSGGPLVIGIVRGMRNITDTVKESRFVERKTHYPLGISEVLHAALARELIEEHWPAGQQ